jgi:hypothetical protein
VRKILSILVALGLLLSFSTMAAPAAGAACPATVTVSPACANSVGATYTVNITVPITLAPGDFLSFEFGAGTTFGTFADGDITVSNNGAAAVGVDAADVAAAAPSLNVKIPAVGMIFAGNWVLVTIPKVNNPGAGTYTLELDYQESCCAPVVCGDVDYTITPSASEYDFFWDSSPMYAGIAEGFIPPFQECGQNVTQGATPVYNFAAGKYANPFNLILRPTLIGCNPPCSQNVTFTLWLAASPTGAKVSFGLNNTAAITHNLTVTDPLTVVTVGNFTLGVNDTMVWNNTIHFDMEGDYQLCFKVWCPPEAAVCPNCDPEGYTVAEECFDIHVEQWKLSFKIPLYAKWNLVSLPFRPFDSDIATMLTSFPNADKVMAIWHYDQCADDWFGYDAMGLTDMVDGDGFWIRMPYGPTAPIGTSYGDWWVFGSDRPYDGGAAPTPFNYEVCQGWNMVGFTPVWLAGVPQSASDKTYLWNWWDVPGTFADYGLIYGWTPATQTWAVQTPNAATLVPGEGYWISFERDGFVYP